MMGMERGLFAPNLKSPLRRGLLFFAKRVYNTNVRLNDTGEICLRQG